MAKPFSEGLYPFVPVDGQAATPATPTADTFRLFVDTDGLLKWVDDAGGVTEAAPQVGTTKGDLYVHDGTNLVRLAVGTDDQVLTADAAEASGVKWAAGGSGSGTTTIVAASGSTQALAMAAVGSDTVYDVTMDENCTFSFTGAASGTAYSVTLVLSGAFTPTFPSEVVWADGTAPTYGSPSAYEFLTTDGGTTVYGFLAGASFS